MDQEASIEGNLQALGDSSKHSVRAFLSYRIQSPLGFATLDKAAPLGLATATPLTDLRQYINNNLGFSDLEI